MDVEPKPGSAGPSPLSEINTTRFEDGNRQRPLRRHRDGKYDQLYHCYAPLAQVGSTYLGQLCERLRSRVFFRMRVPYTCLNYAEKLQQLVSSLEFRTALSVSRFLVAAGMP